MKLSYFWKQFESIFNFLSLMPEPLVKKMSKIKLGQLNSIFALKRSNLQDQINTITQ